MSIQTDLDSLIDILQARLEWAHSQTVFYVLGEQKDAADRALVTAENGFNWLAGEGRTAVIEGLIPFTQWQVGAEGVADLLTQLSAFDDAAGFKAMMADLATRTGQTVISAGKAASPDTSTLVILAVIVVAILLIKVS